MKYKLKHLSLKELKSKLNKCVSKEKYEKADKIKKLIESKTNLIKIK